MAWAAWSVGRRVGGERAHGFDGQGARGLDGRKAAVGGVGGGEGNGRWGGGREGRPAGRRGLVGRGSSRSGEVGREGRPSQREGGGSGVTQMSAGRRAVEQRVGRVGGGWQGAAAARPGW